MNARIALGALLVTGLVWGQDLAELKAGYGARRAALVAERDGSVGKTLAAYRAELGVLLANVKQQGNLDYVLAIEAEQKRLGDSPSAPREPAPKSMAHLRRIQWAARQAEDKADADLAEQAGKLRTQYVAALGKLEKDLVAANRIDEAKAARGEREGAEGETKVAETTLLKAYIDGDTDLILEDGKVYWVVPASRSLVGVHRGGVDPVYVGEEKWYPEWVKRQDGARVSKPLRLPGVRETSKVTVHPKLHPDETADMDGPVVRIEDPAPGAQWYFISVRH